MKNKLFLSEFWLKIIALITMTFYHVALFLNANGLNPILTSVFFAIGRIAFPLFAFMIVEGATKTKHFGKYLLRLGVLAIIILIGEIVASNYNDSYNLPSPIIELILIAITIYLLDKRNKFSFLSILPISFVVLCFVIELLEKDYTITFLPKYLRADYSLYGLLLSIGFYYSSDLAKFFLESKEDTKAFINTPLNQVCKNIISAFVIIFVSLGFYILMMVSGEYLIGWEYASYSAFASIPLLFYSGTRGYNAKWFKYGSYLYFPLHLIIIYIIFSIL